MSKKFEGSEVRHGSHSGWTKHIKDFPDEDPCDSCKAAKAEYDARRLAAPEATRRNRLMAKAQARALKQLKDRHPGEYQELYLINRHEILTEEGMIP